MEEFLRAYAPVTMARLVREDMNWRGADMKAEDWILLSFPAANRDPAVFDRPDELDVARADNSHLGFGAGIHFCVGAPLARVELQSSLRTLLTRFPGLAPAETPHRRPEFVLRGVQSLPVTVRTTSRRSE